jgi:hypothetical protein
VKYVINGGHSTGALTKRRDTVISAIEAAIEMMGQGFSDVTISSPDGMVYRHTEFPLLLEKEKGEDAPRF